MKTEPADFIEKEKQKTSIEKSLTEGVPWKVILRYSIPMFLGNILLQVYNVVDTIIAGNLIGKNALAAVGSSGAVMFLMASFYIGIGMGATIIISQYYGAKDFKNMRKVIDTFMIFAYVFSFVFMVSGYFITNPVLRFMNIPSEIFLDAKKYLTIIFVFSIGLFGYNTTVAVLQGVGDSKTPLYFLAVTSVLNIILDIAFVKYIPLGVQGLALATVISNIVSFILCVVYVNIWHKDIGFHLIHAHFHFSVLLKIFKVGIPSSIQQMIVALSIFLIQGAINSFGTTVMAGVNAAAKVENIVFVPAVNFGNALSVYVGQNVGANNYKRVQDGVVSTVVMTAVASIAISLIAFFFGENLIMLFNREAAVVAAGTYYLKVISPFYIALALVFTLLGAIRGSGNTFTPMLISAATQLVIRLPLVYLFLHFLKTELAIWLAMPTSWISGFIIALIYYKSGNWKKYSLVKK